MSSRHRRIFDDLTPTSIILLSAEEKTSASVGDERCNLRVEFFLIGFFEGGKHSDTISGAGFGERGEDGVGLGVLFLIFVGSCEAEE